jgi:hypothetical protein
VNSQVDIVAKNTYKWVALIAVSALVIGGAILAYYFVVMAPQSETEGFTSSSTSYSFLITNTRGSELNDSEIGIYRYEKPVGFTQAALEALVLGDYSWHKTKTSGESYTPDEDTYVYLITVNCTGYQAIQRIPMLGANNISLAATPSSTKIGGLANDLTSTINQTDQTDWEITIRFLDAESEINDTMGYKGYTNYSAGYKIAVKNIIIIDTNATTAARSFIADTSLVGEYTIADDKIIIETNENYLGEQDFTLKFNTNLGVTYEIESLIYAFGTASEYTTLATMV